MQTDLSNNFEDGIEGRDAVNDLLVAVDGFLAVADTIAGFLIILMVYYTAKEQKIYNIGISEFMRLIIFY